MADGKELVDMWLHDVSRAARGRNAALSVLRAERSALDGLNHIPRGYKARIEPIRARILDTIALLEEREREYAELIPEFMFKVDKISDPIVAEALILRVMQGKTWQQCAMKLHINRTHLERLYKNSLPDLAKLVPNRYRGNDLQKG